MRAFPLRSILILPFLFMFLMATSIIGWISQSHIRDAGERIGRQFIAEMGNRIEAEILQLTNILPTITLINCDAVLNGRFNQQNPQTMAPALVDQIRHFPHLTFISFGFTDGHYIAAIRNPKRNGQVKLMANFLDEPMMLAEYTINADGAFGIRTSTPYAYDPRERPFMKFGARLTEPGWDEITQYPSHDTCGTAVVTPIRNQNGTLIGVAAAAMALDSFDQFMRSLKIGKQGLAFVAEPDGTLISTSTSDPSFYIENNKLKRIRISSHPHPVLLAAAPFLSKPSSRILSKNKIYLFDLRQVSNPYGLSWQVGVLLPESEFMSAVNQSKRKTFLLIALTILIAVILGTFLARTIASPIERISGHARRLALGEMGQDIRQHYPIKEIDTLAHSLGEMANDLSEMIDTLEDRVAERTQEIQKVNTELERLSSLDGLTGIANRRSFDKILERESSRARREKSPLSLIIADIDEFKRFNDRFGHQRGDEVLQKFAQCLTSSARRPGDFSARYGGEEFAVILPNTDFEGALTAAQSIQNTLFQTRLLRDDLPWSDRVTVSLGIASFSPDMSSTPAQLIAEADRQLYRAKQAGRNRIMPQKQ